jgi:hypothetical protein
MALPSSGSISLNQMHIEVGGSSGSQVSLNDSDIRGLISKSSGAQMSFSEWYGASAIVNIALTISSNTNNYNIFNSKGSTYVAGKTNVTLTINSGVSVGSTSTGTYALHTGQGWASGDTLTIVNNGTIKGRGGDGGVGGSRANVPGTNGAPPNQITTAAAVGNDGGNAFRAQFATTFTNNGSVYGGGAGGGGGGSATTLTYGYKGSGGWAGGSGGGGGAGVNGGSGGAGGTAEWTDALTNVNAGTTGATGSSGTSTSGGAGGAAQSMGDASGGAGGSGGGLGSNGSSGSTGTSTSTLVEAGAAGGTRGYYQVGLNFINSGNGVGGTFAGRSSL